MPWIPIGKADEFALNEIREVLVAGGVIAVVRTPSGFHAFDNNCAHMGVALSRGRIEGDTVICPMHNWAHDLRSGRISYPPRAGRFATFFTKVEDGEAFVWPAVRTENDIECDAAQCPAGKAGDLPESN